MQPQTVIDRLKQQVPTLKHVAGTSDFAQAEKLLRNQIPSAFVIPLAERGSPNSVAVGAVSQIITVEFGVILAVSNLRDPGGQKAMQDLYSLRESVIRALVGWSPPDAFDLVEFSSGRLLDMSEQVLWWQDDFQTSINRRSA